MFADILQDKEEVQSENESPFTDSAEATTEKTDATSEKEKGYRRSQWIGNFIYLFDSLKQLF